MLGEAIQESWEPQVQEQWRDNRLRVTEAVLAWNVLLPDVVSLPFES
jgi:hypothetical protein